MWPSRWRGQAGRLEVWYATLTDPLSGDGLWLHHELVAPADGSAAFVHGWAACFPRLAAPLLERFGPAAVQGRRLATGWPAGVSASRLWGSAGELAWDLTYTDASAPLYTFPRQAWERELLPAAQVVPAPSARFGGTIEAGGRSLRVAAGHGAVARIYGHGNAGRWVWLHADLGGTDGSDVLEIVAAVSTRPGLRALPALPFVQLRVDGVLWPAQPLTAAPRLRAGIGEHTWTVAGTVGDRRLRVEVTLPRDQSVSLTYHDPDGATATCTNSERASARIVLEAWTSRWSVWRSWELDGTAHAEIGRRP